MARFKLTRETPAGRMTATYGHDRHIEFFCTVTQGRNKLVDYDALCPDYSGLPGLLRNLTAAGVFTQEAVNEALRILPLVDEAQEIDDNNVRAAAEVISNLKAAAAE